MATNRLIKDRQFPFPDSNVSIAVLVPNLSSMVSYLTLFDMISASVFNLFHGFFIPATDSSSIDLISSLRASISTSGIEASADAGLISEPSLSTNSGN